MHRSARLAAPLLLVLAVSACVHAAAPSPPASEPSASRPAAPPGSPPGRSGGQLDGRGAPDARTPEPTLPPASPVAVAPTERPPRSPIAPSATPSIVPAEASAIPHDPRKFGFAAKGMSAEMIAFVTQKQLDYAVDTMDWDTVSTVAFFSLEATRDGRIADDKGWRAWNSARMDRLIERARATGTKVVISLERFAWSPSQTAVSRALLEHPKRRDRLARIVADEVARRGVDGVNVDFEPIPPGQRDEFTAFVKSLRRELDRVAPGLQLTFCVIGHHESYDVAAATGPDAADAVYLMGYHYAGTWSTRAASTAPMGGPQHDVADSVKSLLRHVEPHELIVGVPYYGHAWPTKTDRLNARTRGGGFDVTLDRAVEIAARHGARYDKVEQVAWVPYRARACSTCPVGWYQLYFDDARALRHKLTWFRDRKLLGTGVWTIGYEGAPGEHAALMREFLRGG